MISYEKAGTRHLKARGSQLTIHRHFKNGSETYVSPKQPTGNNWFILCSKAHLFLWSGLSENYQSLVKRSVYYLLPFMLKHVSSSRVLFDTIESHSSNIITFFFINLFDNNVISLY